MLGNRYQGRLKKMELGDSARAFLEREIRRNDFDLLPISFEHVTSVQDLEPHHRDPFDRLLVAQAICEGLPIVSGDAIFDKYAIGRLW